MDHVHGFAMGIGGESGEGIMLAGDILTLAAARSNIHVSSVRVFPAEIRGGPSLHRTRYGVDHVYNQGDKYEIFVAFSTPHYERHRADIAPNAVILMDGDPETFQPQEIYPELANHVVYVVPMEKVARGSVGDPRSKNMVAVGACSFLFNFSRPNIEKNLAERYQRKDEEVFRHNLAGFVAGFDYAQSQLTKRDPFMLKEGKGEGLLIFSGNEAIGLGALMAGCRFFGGYPITPASEIMEFMAAELPKVGGVMLQAEDEIASIGMVLGASFAGARAMTATSGPGLSLMTELMGLGGMAEIPAVVVDVQRGGPSTGLPTKTEQSDLALALALSHGDVPKVVLAPISVHDCYDIMFQAFEIAEKYQVPVVVLTEQAVGHRRTDLPMSILRDIPQVNPNRPPQTFDPTTFVRYALTESGVSPRSFPGDRGGAHVVTGLEHGENGAPRHDPENRKVMMEKRARKLDGIARDYGDAWRFGPEAADIGIIGWGATAGVVREAVEKANAMGMSVAAIYPKILFPNPDRAIRPFISKHKVIIVIEENQSGQYANFLSSIYGAELGFKPERLTKYDGLPFMPQEVLDKIAETAERHDLSRDGDRGRKNPPKKAREEEGR
jgi:2-oxoglutarate/2-oxoacid ferredoxin oxidoreductase subunit alpha